MVKIKLIGVGNLNTFQTPQYACGRITTNNDIVVARASAWPEGYVREHDDQSYDMYKGLAAWFAREDAGSVEGDVSAAEAP